MKSKKHQIQAVEMPPVKEYLKTIQRDGSELCAGDVFSETMRWLKEKGYDSVVAEQTVEQYAMSVARWVHLEEMISKYGYIAKHPTTGAPMQSPYVTMAQAYAKQATEIRNEINQLIKNARPTIKSDFVREVVYGE